MIVNRAEKLRMLEEMMLIRYFEEKIRNLGIVGPFNQVLGEEAVLVGVRNALMNHDLLISMNRYYGHQVEQGHIGKIMALLNGKLSLCLKSKHRSLKLLGIEFEQDSSLVHNNDTVIKEDESLKKKVMAVLIDDEMSLSVRNLIHMSLQWKLPIVFVSVNRYCGNDAGKNFFTFIREKGDYEIVHIDGLNVFNVYEAAGLTMMQIRRVGGPRFIECKIHKGAALNHDKKINKLDPVEICKLSLLDDQLPYIVLETLEQRVEHISEKGIQIMKEASASSIENAYKEAYANMYKNSLLKG